MPTAADTKLWNASWVICERYDIVVSPAYDCQLVLVVNEAAVSNAWRSATPRPMCRGLSGSTCLQPQDDVGQRASTPALKSSMPAA